MRPTGRLHLGNYWGALRNWVSLIDTHECYFEVADWHMLTTGYDDTERLQENVREMVLDWLAAGLDPEKCVIFKQSLVPEHAELTVLLGMVTPLSMLENNPTWKEQLQELAKTKLTKAAEGADAAPGHVERGQAPRNRPPYSAAAVATAVRAQHELRTHGHLGYPVLQAADILLYKGAKVPVGQDQLPHLELAREIARKFNALYGTVFPEPQPLLTPTPKVPGLDGRKMSKSYGNAVDVYETADSLKTKVMAAYTDPTRLKATDPGHPLPCPENPPGCTVFALHRLYGELGFVEKREAECREGRIGCVACKKDLAAELEPSFAEFRRKREKYAKTPGLVQTVIEEGSKKARVRAQRTMDEVRRAMRLV